MLAPGPDVYSKQGSQQLWKSGKTLQISFQFPSQGKLWEFVPVTQKGKVFASLGYVCLVPCVLVVLLHTSPDNNN